MRLIYSLIYNPFVNKVLRNVNYLLAPVLPNKLKIHPSGIIKLKVDKDNSILIEANQTSYIARQLFWKGCINYEYSAVFVKLIKNVGVFLDIGSSIGYYSVLGATLNKNLKVEAFEPSEGPMHYLKSNVRLNDLSSQINVHNLALSNQSGEIDFFEIKNKKYPWVRNLSGEHNTGTKKELDSKKVRVNSETLDYFVNSNQIGQIDLLKIDTEGSEHLILKGGSKSIEKFKPIIICEVLYNKIEGELEDIMLAYGYEFYFYKKDKLYKANAIRRAEDNGIRDYFFVHPSKKSLIEEFIAK